MMTPERWQQVDHLFHSALECAPDARGAFLLEACADDELLRAEVQSLIDSHEKPGNFLDESPADIAADLFADSEAELLGQTIGQYKILSLLGEGGMGQVYLAEDLRLGRPVALKRLPAHFTLSADRVRRFEQEARAASALNHPNIVTIHEIGNFENAQFIVTEFVAGRTLRQLMDEKPFNLNEALDVSIQVAGALTAAHAAGIVHRDIKPENIMLRADGYVKILDFGLAKLTERRAANSELETSTLHHSSPGLVMGTVQYMSPEQARAGKIDARADIWSLGVVLYELLAGHVPFSGETPSHVMVSVMEDELPPLRQCANVPLELDQIVARSLSKRKKERYQTARELAHDLKNLKRKLREGLLKLSLEVDEDTRRFPRKTYKTNALSSAPDLAARTVKIGVAHRTSNTSYLVRKVERHRLAVILAAVALIGGLVLAGYLVHRARALKAKDSPEAIDSIAVLPFVNVTNDSNVEYLSDGISDSIIKALSRLPSLKVPLLKSVMPYKGKPPDLQQIGNHLGVRAVLTGQMTLQGNHLVVTTELVDLRENRRLWSEQYDRQLSDILVVQKEIVRVVTDKLWLRLTSEQKQKLDRSQTQNPEAYRLYSLAMQFERERTEGARAKAFEYLEQAIKIDPNYTLAYTAIFRFYHAPEADYRLHEETREKKERVAVKAIELDEGLAEAHLELAQIKTANWEWAAAEKEYQRALELYPRSADSNFDYASFLMEVGRADEALPYAKKAEEYGGYMLVFQVHLYQGDYDRAIEALKGSGSNKLALREIYVAKGMYKEALELFPDRVTDDQSPMPWWREPLRAYAYSLGGRRREALKILAEQQKAARGRYISPFNFALIYTGLGDRDRAFEYLNKACQDHELIFTQQLYAPWLKSLYQDPRFEDLLRCVKLAS